MILLDTDVMIDILRNYHYRVISGIHLFQPYARFP